MEKLTQLLEALGHQQLLEELPTLAKRFRREDGAFGNAWNAVGDAANSAGDKVGEALGWAGNLFTKEKKDEPNQPVVEFEDSVEEKSNAVILSEMDRLTQRFAAGELTQQNYNEKFAKLIEQLKE